MKREFVIAAYLLLSILMATPVFAYDQDRVRPRFFEGALSVYPAPSVGKEVTMILDLAAVADNCENATIQFRAPTGVNLLGKDVFEDQYFARNLPYRCSVDIKVLKEGRYTLQATVYFQIPDGQRRVEHFFYYLTVGEPRSRDVKTTPSLAPGLIAPLATGGTIDVKCRITYYNDNLGRTVPIREVKVDLLEHNSSGTSQISNAYTDNDGFCSFGSVTNVDPEDGTGRDILIRVTFENDVLKIELSEDETEGAVYVSDSSVMYNVADGQIEIDYSLGSKNQDRGLGHIFNTIMDAHNFLMDNVNWHRSKITVKWPYGDWSLYKYRWYAFMGRIFSEYIQIPAGREWDRTTIIHEYGHAVMVAMYGYNSYSLPQYSFQGEEHQVFTVSDLGFAMREGWAEFFEAAVDDDAYNVTGYSNRNIPNIESNRWWTGAVDGIGNNTRGEIIEGAVASIFWDIADTSNSHDESPGVDDDDMDGMIKEIWQVMIKHKPGSILEFWDHWVEDMYDQAQPLYSVYKHNAIKVSLPWDINGDGATDLLDFAIISSHFGEWIRSSVYPNPDINRDGEVDILDLVIWAGNATP